MQCVKQVFKFFILLLKKSMIYKNKKSRGKSLGK